MQPYWITFERVPRPFMLNLGMGVTGRSEADAKRIASAVVADMTILGIAPVTDLATLDQGHVIPNMGDISQRGVWFPLGYSNPVP